MPRNARALATILGGGDGAWPNDPNNFALPMDVNCLVLGVHRKTQAIQKSYRIVVEKRRHSAPMAKPKVFQVARPLIKAGRTGLPRVFDSGAGCSTPRFTGATIRKCRGSCFARRRPALAEEVQVERKREKEMRA